VDPIARAWFDHRTSAAADWPLELLLAHKASQRITVILPALDEEATVGDIVEAIRRDLMEPACDLVDDLVVLDSGSVDATAARAATAGARVLHREDLWPQIPTLPGKGEAMWRALGATDGDIVVFVDADLRSFTPSYITGLLGPLLTDSTVSLVKAVYERPFVDGVTTVPAGGGRVTELVARPLLNLHWPELAGVAQPLAGEYAARRSLLETLPFPTGYGVEFAMLVDTAAALGLDAIAQVDLGVRLHHHQDEQRLGRMAAEIWQTALARLDPDGRVRRPRGTGADTVVQFVRSGDVLHAVDHSVVAVERPPLVSVPGYRGSTSMPSRRADRAR
jgi:glucosyl-3-phosphoglycerate synthase